RNERMLATKVKKKFTDKLVSPIDYIAIRDAKVQTILASNLKRSDQLIDIGLSTQRLFKASVKNAKSIVYNGCLGSLVTGAESGTQSIAQALPIKNKIQSIVGGGDTVGFLQSKNLLSHFSFVSTGGGAMLAYLAGKKLPGLEVLEKK
ncbi:MAG: Phosphoglycerate kinase, partial [Candidatus Uhrbacteria bacterium GW2011_GWF2_41_40]